METTPFSLQRSILACLAALLLAGGNGCQTTGTGDNEVAADAVFEPDPEFAEGIPLGEWEHTRRMRNVVAPLQIQQKLTLTPAGEAVIWTRYDAFNDAEGGIGYGRFAGQKRINWVTNIRTRKVSRKENQVIVDTAATKRPRLVHTFPEGSSIIDLRTLGGTMPESVLFGIDQMGAFTFEIDGKDLILVDEEKGTRIRYRYEGRLDVSEPPTLNLPSAGQSSAAAEFYQF
ncbi:MAG: hypothetical protein KDN19_18605 [Verrucomicrobiae bacterium]|nr:hypothetical protein [Verrucomicrobiae bacterium]